ncbi:MAG: glycosyltransferase family 9 protein [Waddliaceae bacterium]
MNRHLLIFLDKTAFQFLFYFFAIFAKIFTRTKGTYPPKLSGTERFLVIRPGGIGDGLMSLPLLKALESGFPKNKITLICLRKNTLAFKHVSYFDELITLDSIDGIFRCLFLFLNRQFDVVLDLEPFRKISAIVSFLSRANIRIGFDTNNRRQLYSHLVSYANEKVFESVNMIRQLEIVGIKVPIENAIDIRFPLQDELVDRSKQILTSKKVYPENNFIVVVVPGVLKPHHRWRMENFAALIHLVLKQDKLVKVLLLGSASDVHDASQVMEQVGENENVVNFVGNTSYTESLGILKMSNILIACDGGVVYMAAAMGCSTLSIWGPGVMERFKPPGAEHIGIRKTYPCIPCVNYSRLGEFPKCPYDRMCIKDISSENVFEKYTETKFRLQNKEDAEHTVRACL